MESRPEGPGDSSDGAYDERDQASLPSGGAEVAQVAAGPIRSGAILLPRDCQRRRGGGGNTCRGSGLLQSAGGDSLQPVRSDESAESAGALAALHRCDGALAIIRNSGTSAMGKPPGGAEAGSDCGEGEAAVGSQEERAEPGDDLIGRIGPRGHS